MPVNIIPSLNHSLDYYLWCTLINLLQTRSNDWINLNVKFSSNCKSCGKKISKGELALWSRSTKSIKHVGCHTRDLSDPSYVSVNSKQLKCAVCGSLAGCTECEFEKDCDRAIVSQLCICKKCYDDKMALENYYGIINPFVTGKKSWHIFDQLDW